MVTHVFNRQGQATLTIADHVAQFGEGYRQISGKTLMEGPAADVLARMRDLPPDQLARAYISNPGGNPMTLREIDELGS